MLKPMDGIAALDSEASSLGRGEAIIFFRDAALSASRMWRLVKRMVKDATVS